MTKLALVAAVALAAGGAVFAQNASAPNALAQEQASPADAALPSGLSDLEKTTFACPKAALNAAAREVAARRHAAASSPARCIARSSSVGRPCTAKP